MASPRQPSGLTVAAIQIAIILAILALWQFGPIDEMLWSRPSLVFPRVAALWQGVEGLPPLSRQIGDTVLATFVGLAGGSALGFVLGVALAEFTTIRLTLAPFLAAANAVPRVAWVPTLTLLFGFGFITKIVMSGLIVFLVVFFNVLDAAVHAPPALLDGVRALGGSYWHRMRDVRIWSSIGAVIASLPNAIAFALVGVVFAESLNAESGLGALMFNAMQRGHPDDLIISALALGIIGLALIAITRGLQRAFAHRLMLGDATPAGARP